MDVTTYRAYAAQMAQQYGIPADLFNRMITQESGWNPNARSSAGAVGLGQLMPGTARDLGVTDRTDWKQSLEGSAKYLSQQFATFGNWGDALAAYNAGPGAVKKYGGIPPFEETRKYVDKILGALGGKDGSFSDFLESAKEWHDNTNKAIDDALGNPGIKLRDWTTAHLGNAVLRAVAVIAGLILITAAVFTFVNGGKISTLLKTVKGSI